MNNKRHGIVRLPTGITGFDEITRGGLPAGRITVVLGGPGSGKTIFGVQILALGAHKFGDSGILVAFEEGPEQVIENTACFDWRLDRLDGKSLNVIDARLPESVIQGGEFDLLGLLAVLGQRAKVMGAKRIVLDGLDVLLANLSDPAVKRREVFRLREWLQSNGMTAIVTAKVDKQDGGLSPEYAFLQFMADCVVTMHHRVVSGTALRFIRVPKCRGGGHSANEFPFTIGESGIEVGGGASTEMVHAAPTARVSSGIDRLDAMLGGGYYRGSSTLITGAPGTAKTTLAAAFADAACRRREPTMFVSFDESPAQIVRNVGSVGIRLDPHVRSGLLSMHSLRSRSASPEAHTAHIRNLLRLHRAKNLVVDPLSAFSFGIDAAVAQRAAVEVLDLAKSLGITSVYTSLLGNKAALSEETPIGVSTIADTWMHLTYVNQGGERNRALTVIKSRGTSHSNQIRELVLSGTGTTLADVYSAGGEVLMGTLRWEREETERRTREASKHEAALREKEAESAVAETRARAQAALSAQAVGEAVLARIRSEQKTSDTLAAKQSSELLRRRGADAHRTARARRAAR
jgi:circadian clock protein KaiC